MDRNLREIQALASRLTMRPIEFPCFRAEILYPPVTRLIDAALRAAHRGGDLLLPELRRENKTLAIFSDYGGESKSSKFYTYSFLVCAYDHLGAFREASASLRVQHMRRWPRKEIAFKDLTFGPIARMLPEFLNAASDLVPGLLFTVVVPKHLRTLIGIGGRGGARFVSSTIEEAGLGAWKPLVAERLLRIAHIAAYLVALLSADRQQLFWMSDDDAIVPNERKAGLAMDLCSRHLSSYTSKTYGTFGYAVPFRDPEEMVLYDLLSLADLAAGSFDLYFTRRHSRVSDRSSAKAEPVLRWLGGNGVSLRRLGILIEEADEGCLGVSRLKGPTPEEGITIPVVV